MHACCCLRPWRGCSWAERPCIKLRRIRCKYTHISAQQQRAEYLVPFGGSKTDSLAGQCSCGLCPWNAWRRARVHVAATTSRPCHQGLHSSSRPVSAASLCVRLGVQQQCMCRQALPRAAGLLWLLPCVLYCVQSELISSSLPASKLHPCPMLAPRTCTCMQAELTSSSLPASKLHPCPMHAPRTCTCMQVELTSSSLPASKLHPCPMLAPRTRTCMQAELISSGLPVGVGFDLLPADPSDDLTELRSAHSRGAAGSGVPALSPWEAAAPDAWVCWLQGCRCVSACGHMLGASLRRRQDTCHDRP